MWYCCIFIYTGYCREMWALFINIELWCPGTEEQCTLRFPLCRLHLVQAQALYNPDLKNKVTFISKPLQQQHSLCWLPSHIALIRKLQLFHPKDRLMMGCTPEKKLLNFKFMKIYSVVIAVPLVHSVLTLGYVHSVLTLGYGD